MKPAPPPPRFLLPASLALLIALSGLSGFHAEDDPNDTYVYDRTESVLHLSLDAPGGTSLDSGSAAAPVGVFLQRYSWQIWRQPSTGYEEYRDASSTPESGAAVSLSLSENMGTLGDTTLTTNAEGLASTTFSPNGGFGGVYLNAAVENSTASLFFDLTYTSPGDDTYVYSRTEGTLVAELTTTGSTSSLSTRVNPAISPSRSATRPGMS